MFYNKAKMIQFSAKRKY